MLQPDNITLAIVDDHPVVIEGIKTLLKDEAGITTISFTSGADLLGYLAKHAVDVILLDIMLPDSSGIEICKEIKALAPLTAVIAFSNQAERSIIMQMLQNGANGYLLKNVSSEELLQCIAEARAGNTELSFCREVKEIMAKPSQYELQSVPSLTKREKEVLRLIADGKTSQQIADELFLSPLTVETHRRNLAHKMSVKNVAELIRMATDYRMI